MCPCCDSLAQGFSKKKLARPRLSSVFVDRIWDGRYTHRSNLKWDCFRFVCGFALVVGTFPPRTRIRHGSSAKENYR